MFVHLTVIMLLCLVLLGCQSEDRKVAKHAAERNLDTPMQPRRSYDTHYMGVGKLIAVVLSAQKTQATAHLDQPWVIRIVDQNGVPINSAEINIIMAAPVSKPPQLLALSGDHYDGDGFYRIAHLPFTDSGKWHLDVRVAWRNAENFVQEDHAAIAVDVVAVTQ